MSCQTSMINKIEEISAYTGLIVLELNNYMNQFCIEDDYIDYEIKSDFNDIIKQLREIQKMINVFVKTKESFDYIYEHKNVSTFLDKLLEQYSKQEDQKETTNTKYPTGYSFVLRAICKKAQNKCSHHETLFFSKLESFFEKLGYYLNHNYYYKYL
jgi:hypothetical protein